MRTLVHLARMLPRSSRRRARLGLLVACAAVLAGATPGQAAKLFVIPQETIGVSVPNPSGPIVRYEVAGPSSAPTQDAILSDASFARPTGLAFGPGNELFVTNWGFPGGPSITRFLDPTGTPSVNGVITSSELAGPEFAAFAGGDLFVAQQFGSNVLQFGVGPHDATFKRVVVDGFEQLSRGIAFAPDGEMLVSLIGPNPVIRRYRFDAHGNAIPHGDIRGNGMVEPHGMAFSPSGELFVANGRGSTVSRFLLRPNGTAVPNGQILTGQTQGSGGPFGVIGLSFAPWGELFVGKFAQPTVLRFRFSNFGQAIPNGSFTVPDFNAARPGVMNIAFAPPPPTPSPDPVAQDHPVGRWRLGERSGTVAHDSAGTNDGTYRGDVTLGLPGVFSDDTAVGLDGSTGYIRVPDAPSLRTDDHFTLEAWIRRGYSSTSVGTEGLFLKSYQLYLDVGRLVLRKPNVGTIARSTSAITDTALHHIVATKSGGSVHLYIDGTDVTGPVTNHTISDSSRQVLAIGAGARTFRGTLDEAAIYDHTLSPARVAAHYAAAQP